MKPGGSLPKRSGGLRCQPDWQGREHWRSRQGFESATPRFEHLVSIQLKAMGPCSRGEKESSRSDPDCTMRMCIWLSPAEPRASLNASSVEPESHGLQFRRVGEQNRHPLVIDGRRSARSAP